MNGNTSFYFVMLEPAGRQGTACPDYFGKSISTEYSSHPRMTK
jgi:hypothetical protein